MACITRQRQRDRAETVIGVHGDQGSKHLCLTDTRVTFVQVVTTLELRAVRGQRDSGRPLSAVNAACSGCGKGEAS